jgi:hypothetical protein
VTNAAFAKELGRALRRPSIFRMPAGLLRSMAGELADEFLLRGQRALPDKALISGFSFCHETVRSAFDAILRPAPVRKGDERRHSVATDAPMIAISPSPPEQPVDQPAVEPAARLLRSLRLGTG